MSVTFRARGAFILTNPANPKFTPDHEGLEMMNRRFMRATSLFILVSVTACSTMQPVAQPREFMEARRPGTIWVTRQSTPAMVELNAPQMVGDSLVGFVEGEYVEIPFNQVQTVQARQYSRGRTMGFILGLTAAAVGMLLLVGSGLGSPDLGGEGEDDDPIGMVLPEPGVTVEAGVRQVA